MRLTCGPPADTSGGHALGTVIVIPDGPPAATVVGAVVGAMMGFPVGTVVGIPVGNVVGIPVDYSSSVRINPNPRSHDTFLRNQDE